ncbi:hypothetical protein [Puia dinghuensis]|uniref:Uncharacterized protein n=1 Tax=Puia dinghuensis TaxID=1792502 RepID=A0A8J2XRY6_9BACT|nr:hypothetical protein [Puia dinghuensis]GGA91048.1 hypothetical protein GCM10011511_12950 [Puia dinghuensis]
MRLKGAFAYKRLLGENGWLPLGTDFPVEDISPFKTFLAAVFRVDAKGFPAGGFQPENALTREEAIRGDDDLGGEGGLSGEGDRESGGGEAGWMGVICYWDLLLKSLIWNITT